MGIDDSGVDAVFLCEKFELLGYAAARDSLTKAIQEDIPGIDASIFQPIYRLCP